MYFLKILRTVSFQIINKNFFQTASRGKASVMQSKSKEQSSKNVKHEQLEGRSQKQDHQNKCTKCNKNFSHKQSLTRHLKMCGKSKDEAKFSCDQCRYKAHRKESLNNHKRSKHAPPDPSNTCSKCKRIFSLRSSLTRHLKICGKSKDKINLPNFLCDHCSYKTHRKDQIEFHIVSKHLPPDPNRNKCKNCHRAFVQKSHLTLHLKTCGKPSSKVSSSKFSCDHCDFKTNKKFHIECHMLNRHLPRDLNLHNCTICKRNFRDRSSLWHHAKICGKTQDEIKLFQLSCDNCGFKTINKAHLTIHMQEKHLPRDPNQNKCNKCGRFYASDSSLWHHFKTCGKPRSDVVELTFACHHCSYKTHLKPSLRSHITYNHLPRHESEFKCRKCTWCFTHIAGLKSHLKVCGKTREQIEELMLSCDHCNYKCLQKPCLERHILLKHFSTDPNANKCSRCNKSFSVRAYLLKHKQLCGRLTISSKLFSCDLCHYRTTKKLNLIVHMKSIHLSLDLNNKCKKCHKVFYAKKNRDSHEKICGEPKRHINPLVLSCNDCNFQTVLKEILEKHIQEKH